MLTQKEVLELSERALAHQALVEKFGFFVSQCNDPQVRNLLQQHQQVFQRHYQTLVNLLQRNRNFTQQNIPTQEYTTV